MCRIQGSLQGDLLAYAVQANFNCVWWNGCNKHLVGVGKGRRK
jgi:hypothetical protein